MTAPPCSSIPSSLEEGCPQSGRGGSRRTPPPPAFGVPLLKRGGESRYLRSIAPSPPAARSRPRRLPREPEPDHVPRHGLGLLHVREMARFGDLLEFRSGNCRAEILAVGERREAVVRAPQEERRNPDAVQPSSELRVVHVGVPREQRGRFAVARHRSQLLLGQRLVVAQPHRRIAERELLPAAARRGEDVQDVALVALAEFGADRPDQDEARQVLAGLGRDLRGDPCAEGSADDDEVAQAELLDQVEVEIRHVVDRAHAPGQLRVPESGMRRGDHLRLAREQLDERFRAVNADVRMEKEDRAPFPPPEDLDVCARDLFGHRAFCGVHVLQSTLILASRMTLPQRSYSVLSSSRSAASVMGCTSAPCFKSISFVSPSARIRLISPCSFASTAPGVAAGANSAFQITTSKSAKPDSAIVGISGAYAERRAPVVAMPRSLPERICGSTVGAAASITPTRPPSTSFTPGGPPL